MSSTQLGPRSVSYYGLPPSHLTTIKISNSSVLERISLIVSDTFSVKTKSFNSLSKSCENQNTLPVLTEERQPAPRINFFSGMILRAVSLLHNALSLARQVTRSFSSRLISPQPDIGTRAPSTSPNTENQETDDFSVDSEQANQAEEIEVKNAPQAESNTPEPYAVEITSHAPRESTESHDLRRIRRDPIAVAIHVKPKLQVEEVERPAKEAIKSATQHSENTNEVTHDSENTNEVTHEIKNSSLTDSGKPALVPRLSEIQASSAPPKKPLTQEEHTKLATERWMAHFNNGFNDLPLAAKESLAKKYRETGSVDMLEELGINFSHPNVQAQFDEMLQTLGMALNDVPHWV